jgi:hypothetical protein
MLQQTLRTKVHLLQAPRISILTCKPRYYLVCIVLLTPFLLKPALASSNPPRSAPSAYLRVSYLSLLLYQKTPTTLGLNTNEFTNVFATKINKIEADVNGLKGDVSTLKTDIRELGVRLERSMTERLGGHALNQEKKLSQHTLNQEKKMSQHTLNQAKQITELYFHSICAVSLTPYIVYQFLTRLRSWVLQYC